MPWCTNVTEPLNLTIQTNFLKQSSACKDRSCKKNTNKAEMNHKDGGEETQEDYPASVQLTIKYMEQM